MTRRRFLGGAFLGGAAARALAANPPGLDFRLIDVTVELVEAAWLTKVSVSCLETAFCVSNPW